MSFKYCPFVMKCFNFLLSCSHWLKYVEEERQHNFFFFYSFFLFVYEPEKCNYNNSLQSQKREKKQIPTENPFSYLQYTFSCKRWCCSLAIRFLWDDCIILIVSLVPIKILIFTSQILKIHLTYTYEIANFKCFFPLNFIPIVHVLEACYYLC